MVIFFASYSHASIQVDYRVSKTHGLFKFLMTLSGEAHHPKGLLELFKRSSHADDPMIQKQLAKFESIKASLFKKIEPGKVVPGRSAGWGVLAAVTTQTILSRNLDDFSQRILNLLPQEDHFVFIEILKRIEPIYDRLLWKTSRPELSKLKLKLEATGSRINLNSAFKKASIFYGAKWPAQTPFVVGLYAVPRIKGFKNSTNSQSLGSVVEHGVLLKSEKNDTVANLAVIFHEISHSLYNAQSFETMSAIQSYFAQSSSKFSNQSYTWINEALATTLDAWITARSNGNVPPKGAWYNDSIIDGFAKEIYPLVSEYLAQGHSIDRNFVEKTIDLFEKKFPNSIYDLHSIMNKVYVVHSGSFLQEPAAMKTLQQFFNVSSYDGNTPIVDKASIEAYSNPAGRPVITVFNDDDLDKIGQISKQIPLLAENLPTLSTMKNRSYFAQFDNKDRVFIFIKVASPEEYELALKKLSSVEKLSPKPEVLEF